MGALEGQVMVIGADNRQRENTEMEDERGKQMKK